MRPTRLLPFVFLFCVLGLIGFIYLRTRSPVESVSVGVTSSALAMTGPQFRPSPASLAEGERLSQSQCSLCHLRPDPQLLRQAAWNELFELKLQLLSDISALDRPLSGPGVSHNVAIFGVKTKPFPEYLVSLDDWAKIIYYYLASSPASEPRQPQRPPFSQRAAPFALRASGLHAAGSEIMHSVTAIERDKLVLGDGLGNQLQVRDADGDLIRKIPLSGTPTGLVRRKDGIYITLIGNSLQPTESADGKLVRLASNAFDKGLHSPVEEVILSSLYRPVRTTFADFTGDEKDELLIEEFGFVEGGLHLYQQRDGEYFRRRIHPKTGVVASSIADFDRDGRSDIAYLAAQNDETLYLSVNQTGLDFITNAVVKKPPSYGYNSLSSADLDGDTLPDIVLTQGDNFDLRTYPLKPYHGVSVHRNMGKGRFQEVVLYPMYGATNSIVADFDNDGDADIVVIAFFPNYSQEPLETAVYLENTGHWQFMPHRIPEADKGRWLSAAAGDVDGDGDLDLALGAAYFDYFETQWTRAKGDSPRFDYVLLENTTQR